MDDRKINKKKFIKMLENNIVEWAELQEKMDEYDKSYDVQTGEIQGLEYVLDVVRGYLKEDIFNV